MACNQEDVRAEIQLYAALTSAAGSQAISTRPKGEKKVVITSVLAMTRVEPLVDIITNKKPPPDKVSWRGFYI